MDKDVRLHQDAPQPTQAQVQETAASSSQSPLLTQGGGGGGGGEGGHVSEIDPGLLPINWPKHVKYLVDYEYHPSIPTPVLDLVQGRRRKLSDRVNNHATGGGLELPEGPDDEGEEQEEKEKEERDEMELEYDDIPLGHAIPGYLPPVSLSGVPGTVPSVSVSAMDLSSSLLAAVNLADPQPTLAFSPAVSAPKALSSLSSTVDPSLTSLTTTLDQSTTTTQQQQQQRPPPPPYEIRLITGPNTHPVLGSYGLFATKNLRPGMHLLDYISLVVPDEHADPDSDHTLYLSNDLNLDASAHGNHGRFVNDFRGIRTQAQGPNVGWDLYRDAGTGQVRMGCKVLKFIGRGEEIVCTYGKAYWKSRGVPVEGEEWEDGWDTDLEDGKDIPSDIEDHDDEQ